MFSLARSHNWLIFAVIDPPLRERLRHHAKGALLDIGCGSKPYEIDAAPYVARHVGLDHADSLHDASRVDVIGTAYDTRFAPATFDTVLCTDVLEHLEDPPRALAEAFRVLKPGGHAIYTAPFFWHLHEEPRDFYRYTEYGLRYLFERAGFVVVEILPLGGFVVTFAQELVYYLYRFRRGGRWNPLWWLIPPIGHVVQGLAYLLHSLDHSPRFAVEHLVVAQRPVPS